MRQINAKSVIDAVLADLEAEGQDALLSWVLKPENLKWATDLAQQQIPKDQEKTGTANLLIQTVIKHPAYAVLQKLPDPYSRLLIQGLKFAGDLIDQGYSEEQAVKEKLFEREDPKEKVGSPRNWEKVKELQDENPGIYDQYKISLPLEHYDILELLKSLPFLQKQNEKRPDLLIAAAVNSKLNALINTWATGAFDRLDSLLGGSPSYRAVGELNRVHRFLWSFANMGSKGPRYMLANKYSGLSDTVENKVKAWLKDLQREDINIPGDQGVVGNLKGSTRYYTTPTDNLALYQIPNDERYYVAGCFSVVRYVHGQLFKEIILRPLVTAEGHPISDTAFMHNYARQYYPSENTLEERLKALDQVRQIPKGLYETPPWFGRYPIPRLPLVSDKYLLIEMLTEAGYKAAKPELVRRKKGTYGRGEYSTVYWIEPFDRDATFSIAPLKPTRES